MSDNMILETVDLRRRLNETQTRSDEILRRKAHLVSRGFSSDFVDKLSISRPTLYTPQAVEKHMDLLTDLGFKDPVKILARMPPLFTSDDETIKGKIDFLKELGFKDPVKILTRMPPIFGYSEENIKRKIGFLSALGFKNPIKMLSSFPSMFALTEENMNSKVNLLEELGFKNPQEIIALFPTLFGYSEEHIKGKIDFLKELGFKDPVKILTTTPPLFGLAEKNIKKRLKFLERAISLYDLPLSSTSLMEQYGPLFSSKLDKIIVLARILREYKVKPPYLNTTLIKNLLFSNLENILVSLSKRENNEPIKDLIERASRIKGSQLSARQKKEIIESDLYDLEKIKQRYFRGYPKSQND